MYHFFVEQSQFGDGFATVTGPDVNHIKNVLRMKPGEKVLLSSRDGGDFLCELAEIGGEEVRLTILEEQEKDRELPARIHLFQGLPKSDKMELIIQKAVELGAYRIIPVETKRVVVKLDARKAEARLKRWNAIAESAAKQSKRSLIPKVEPVLSFRSALSEASGFEMKLIPYECAEGIRKTKELLKTAAAGLDIAVFIGPEGGFEEAEILSAQEAGVEAVTLGRRILRTETAGLCILSALMLQLEE